MELKGVSLVVMLLILLVTGNAQTEDRCYPDCIAACPIPISNRCVDFCRHMCSVGSPLPGLAQKTKDHHHHHCKLGCSHHCAKYRDDEKKMARCMHHCETNCNIKAPSPSPILQ
ncbi:hypothetical protein M0R45_024384 [Rubus argutus]|uniref:Uncharacterized protein n=1 Tax=Rubus argutus TaxID=59490 RepID=A0AAW1WT14_RUBAR